MPIVRGFGCAHSCSELRNWCLFCWQEVCTCCHSTAITMPMWCVFGCMSRGGCIGWHSRPSGICLSGGTKSQGVQKIPGPSPHSHASTMRGLHHSAHSNSAGVWTIPRGLPSGRPNARGLHIRTQSVRDCVQGGTFLLPLHRSPTDEPADLGGITKLKTATLRWSMQYLQTTPACTFSLIQI